MKFLSKSSKFEIVNPVITVGNYLLKAVNEGNYLGVILNKNLEEKQDIIIVRNKFFNKFNMLLRKFNNVDLNVFLRLLKTYCLQFYRAELWFGYRNYSQVLKQFFSIGYHNAIMKIFFVSSRESNGL